MKKLFMVLFFVCMYNTMAMAAQGQEYKTVKHIVKSGDTLSQLVKRSYKMVNPKSNISKTDSWQLFLKSLSQGHILVDGDNPEKINGNINKLYPRQLVAVQIPVINGRQIKKTASQAKKHANHIGAHQVKKTAPQAKTTGRNDRHQVKKSPSRVKMADHSGSHQIKKSPSKVKYANHNIPQNTPQIKKTAPQAKTTGRNDRHQVKKSPSKVKYARQKGPQNTPQVKKTAPQAKIAPGQEYKTVKHIVKSGDTLSQLVKRSHKMVNPKSNISNSWQLFLKTLSQRHIFVDGKTPKKSNGHINKLYPRQLVAVQIPVINGTHHQVKKTAPQAKTTGRNDRHQVKKSPPKVKYANQKGLQNTLQVKKPAPQAKNNDYETTENEADGFILNETLTRVGQSFFDGFFFIWWDDTLSKKTTTIVREKINAWQECKITIEIGDLLNNKVVFTSIINMRESEEEIKKLALQAKQTVRGHMLNSYIKNTKQTKG